jgi:uncharacterized HAD superfamily protein
MNHRSIHDMNMVIRGSLQRLPWKPDVIAGVHKSGMLAASMFGAHLNVPVVPLRQLWEADWIYSGLRGLIKEEQQNAFLSSPRRVLIVEDAAGTGKTIGKQLQILKANQRAEHKYFSVVVFGTKPKVGNFHLVLDVCPGPRIFEWNWVDHFLLGKSILDIDGVLCPDPPTPEERTGPYMQHIERAPPLYVPKRKVMALATSRLEKYRDLTENWLQANKIQYGRLYMAQFDTPAERRKFKNFRVKAEVYKQLTEARLFVESHDNQAGWIAKETKRPVFSVESRSLFNG